MEWVGTRAADPGKFNPRCGNDVTYCPLALKFMRRSSSIFNRNGNHFDICILSSLRKKMSGILLIAVMLSGCEKEPVENTTVDRSDTFIPAGNKKYFYQIGSDGSGSGTATQWISGERDSSGITVFNLHTDIEASGSLMSPLPPR
jgi:hypothetical protein